MENSKGSWVEIEKVLLTPDQRAPQCPEDTRKTSYVMKVSGFLDDKFAAAKIGEEVQITTLIGRTIEGKLISLSPCYEHSFGPTVEELLPIGKEDLFGGGK